MIVRYTVGVHSSKESAWDAFEEAMKEDASEFFADEDIENFGEKYLAAYVGYEVVLHVAINTETRKLWIEKIDGGDGQMFVPERK
jgi:hypothetical protein